MSVTYDILNDWPDAASIDSEAENLLKQGASFDDTVTDAKASWEGLSGHYETEDAHLLIMALNPAVNNSESVAQSATLASAAMGGFASALQELGPRRRQLLKEAEEFNLKICPTDEEGSAEYQQEQEELQSRINALGNEYREAISECTNRLTGIDSRGDYSDPNAPDVNGAALGQVPSLGTSIAQSKEFMRLRISRALRLWTNLGDTRVMQWLAKRSWLPSWLGDIKGSVRIPLPPKTTSSTSWKFKGPPPPGNYWQRFATILKETFLGPPKPTTVPSEPVVTMETGKGVVGAGVEKAGATTSGVTTAGRVLGRGFFAAGIAMTFGSEYAKADERLKTEQPGLSDGERFAKAGEKATVRTGGQVVGAAVAGAAIGSAIPVGGTAVGFAVGLGVGAAMTFVQIGGKSLGDWTADGFEGAWNLGKGAGEGIFNSIKGLFG